MADAPQDMPGVGTKVALVTGPTTFKEATVVRSSADGIFTVELPGNDVDADGRAVMHRIANVPRVDPPSFDALPCWTNGPNQAQGSAPALKSDVYLWLETDEYPFVRFLGTVTKANGMAPSIACVDPDEEHVDADGARATLTFDSVPYGGVTFGGPFPRVAPGPNQGQGS